MVSTAEIAATLRVRSPSVTGMLKRLAEADYIVYESGAGANLQFSQERAIEKASLRQMKCRGQPHAELVPSG